MTDQNDRRTSKKRWIAGGWSSQDRAVEHFRRIWKRALLDGIVPGDDLGAWNLRAHQDLRWLVEGHPKYPAMTAFGIEHFTFQPDGRGNHRFVLVDTQGKEHPFSTVSALTGFDMPLREPPNEDAPLGGLST